MKMKLANVDLAIWYGLPAGDIVESIIEKEAKQFGWRKLNPERLAYIFLMSEELNEFVEYTREDLKEYINHYSYN